MTDYQRNKLQIDSLFADLLSLVDRIKIVKGQLLSTNEAKKRRADLVRVEMEKLCNGKRPGQS